ncbi:ATP-dependent helicase HrpA [Cystobacter fuscus]|nr:ATP-dependent helicase HrpA [Cystobacter fuscus]
MALEAAASKEQQKERTPRVDWAQLLRKTFDFDAFACVRCGGRRRGLPMAGARLAPAPGPSQAAWC